MVLDVPTLLPRCYSKEGQPGLSRHCNITAKPTQYYYQVCQRHRRQAATNNGKREQRERERAREREREKRHQDGAVQLAERANISFSSSLPHLPPHYTLPQFSSHSITALPCHSHLPRPHHHHSFFTLVSIPASQLFIWPISISHSGPASSARLPLLTSHCCAAGLPSAPISNHITFLPISCREVLCRCFKILGPNFCLPNPRLLVSVPLLQYSPNLPTSWESRIGVTSVHDRNKNGNNALTGAF